MVSGFPTFFNLSLNLAIRSSWSEPQSAPGLVFANCIELLLLQGIDLDYCDIEWFYEDLQDLLELTPKKDVLFIIGDWNANVGSQETPGVTGKFGLGIRNEAGQRLIEFCQ